MTDPTPPIASVYSAGDSTTVIYTMENHVPSQSIPFTLSGISPPVSRVKVNNDCENIIPPGPTGTCQICILIAPTKANIGHTYNQTLYIDTHSPHNFTKQISFTVQEASPKPAQVSISQ